MIAVMPARYLPNSCFLTPTQGVELTNLACVENIGRMRFVTIM